MPRKLRIAPIGVAQHIIQRGNNRQVCFCNDEDMAVYVEWLKQYSVKFNVHIHAWVLMTNHVHLLCTPQSANGVSLMMQSLGACTLGTLIIGISVLALYGRDDLNQHLFKVIPIYYKYIAILN